MRRQVMMRHVWALGVAVATGGCAPALTYHAERAPRALYERELRRMENGDALAREWSNLGNAAAQAALRVGVPFDETVLFAEGRPGAIAYRFALRRADRFHAEVEPPRLRERGVFLELFEVVPGDPDRLLLITESAPGAHALRTLIPRAGEYVLLIQPRLEHHGRYRVSMATGGSVPAEPPVAALAAIGPLHFPVYAHTPRAIRSGFGAPRDGGRRQHHGVDIFAPRGTAVLAAADGRITAVANTSVGGRVIWQVVDGTGVELYYAHLSEQYVRRGQHVRAGETIGAVGNTGNARSTPPHLHFGVYLPGRRPVDPEPILRGGAVLADRPAPVAPPVARAETGPPPDIGGLGDWLQTRASEARLRAAPAADADAFVAVAAGTPVRLIGGTTAWYRVALPDGVTGFVEIEAVGRFDAPLRTKPITARTALLENTTPGARALETIYGGEHVDVLATHDRHLLVRTTTGRVGWIESAGAGL